MVAQSDVITELRTELERRADPVRAAAMAAYMKNRFEFFGVPAPDRKLAAKEFIAGGKAAQASRLLDTADALWSQPEREFQYVAVSLLERWVRALDADSLQRIERLIRSKPWWDTVDGLASNVVGPIVATNPQLASVMDDWIDDDDIWIARTAILHQLKYGPGTDVERLFRYVDRRATDTEFFIRKACGWALRQCARRDPEAVREFVESRRDRLSGLTVREATKQR